MNLRKQIGKAALRMATSMLGPNVWKNLGSVLSSSGPSADLHVPGMDKPASNFVWVYNCVVARMEAMMQAALRISDAQDNLIEGGALYDLLARPNRWMDGVQFVGAVEALMTARNACFIVPVSEGAGTYPDELMLLSPANMRPILAVHTPTGAQVPIGYTYRDPSTGQERRFQLDELIPIQTFNPDNPLISALNPMDALMRSLKMDMATREQNLALYANGGLPDFALVTDRAWNEDQAKEFLRRFLDNYQGYGKAHKPAVLYNGVKIDKVGLNPEELQSLEVLKTLTPQEIVAGLRTKPVMAGLMVGETGLSQGTSTEEQKVAWWSETGHAELARIASAIQQFLVDPYDWNKRMLGARRTPMSPAQRREFGRQKARMRPFVRASTSRQGLYVWFDTNNIPELMEHRWKRVQEFDKLAGRGYRPDDLNDYFDLGLPPHPTNQGTLPFSVQPVDDLVASSPSSNEPREGSHPNTRAIALIDSIEAHIERRQREIAAKWKALRRTLDGLLKPREKAAASRFSKFYIEQRKRVLDRFDEALQAARSAREETAKDIFREDELLREIFPTDEENTALYARLSPIWTQHLKDGWSFFSENEKPEGAQLPDFHVEDPRVLEALEKRKIQGTAINDTTEDAVREVLREGFEAGDTAAQLAERVDEYYKTNCIGEDKHRPMTAARTQTTGIVNDGRMLAAREVGGLKKGWLHGGSAEARPEHVAAQTHYLEEPIGLDEQFIVNGYACDAPGDSTLPVGETANCTCMVSFHAA